MRKLLKPKWILITNILPLCILLILFFKEFNCVKTHLNFETIKYWNVFFTTLATVGFINAAYACYLLFRKQNVSVWYALIALLSYTALTYCYYCYYLNKLFPPSVPDWLISKELITYVGTFIMPGLIYSLFILVTYFSSKKQKIWPNFTISIMIPIVWYVFVTAILPLYKNIDLRRYEEHIFLIFTVISAMLFIFFTLRGAVLIAKNRREDWPDFELAAKMLFSVAFPLAGLLFNDAIGSVFGDFSSIWFIILTILNLIAICMPNFKNKNARFFLFIARSFTFSYTVYFFIVFLPFTPLSFLAIPILGIGLLTLTPLVLFIIHINELKKDYRFLKTYYSSLRLALFSTLAFLFIPFCITVSYYKDRKDLHRMLEYVYSPDYSKKYEINKSSIKKTLRTIRASKQRGFMSEGQTPYLSGYFNWLVLDNLSLSNSKLKKIGNIFFRYKLEDQKEELLIKDEHVKISSISTKSSFDTSQNAWLTWVDLEITNDSYVLLPEYITRFQLPEGCWISDYYLYVGEKKEMGILSEKRTALWLYSNIRNYRKDPGILYYLNRNEILFRIFPFQNDEIRKTGIEFLHKEPVRIEIDGHSILLGEENTDQVASETGFEKEDIAYISSQKKEELSKVYREPYFHFLVDTSEESKIEEYSNRIERFSQQHQALSFNAKISSINTYVQTYAFDKNWKTNIRPKEEQGGFHLDRAIKKALFIAYKENKGSYPIIIVISDYWEYAALENNFLDWEFTFPENNLFYNLVNDSTLLSHSLISNAIQATADTIKTFTPTHVLEYRFKDNTAVYLPDNKKASIAFKSDFVEIKEEKETKTKQWEKALEMQCNWLSQILHPEKENKQFMRLLRGSFGSKVMMPISSYLVVETENQKLILKKKQDKVLGKNQYLDLEDLFIQMSEPNLFFLIALLVIAFWIKKRRATSRNKEIKE